MRKKIVPVLSSLVIALFVAGCPDDGTDSGAMGTDMAMMGTDMAVPTDMGPGTDAAGNQAPTASFTMSETCIPAGDGNATGVDFSSTSTDPEMDVLTCSWSFQGGTPLMGMSCDEMGVTFPGAAPYVIMLTVDDGNGNMDTTMMTLPLC